MVAKLLIALFIVCSVITGIVSPYIVVNLVEDNFKDKPKPVLTDGRYKKALDKACSKYGDYRYYSYCEQLAGD